MTSANTIKTTEIRNRIGHDSQLRKIMDHMVLKGNISAMEARNLYRVERLTSRIHELKKLGLDIISERRYDLTNTAYTRYFLL